MLQRSILPEIAMEVKPRLTLEQLKQLERSERDAGQSKRLRAGRRRPWRWP
jgi:hypothetical protein